MKIKTISYSGSNPSLGPHNRPSEKYVDVGSNKGLANDFLDNTTVNNQVTLRSFIDLHIKDQKDRIQEIQAAYEAKSLNEGERIINLNITLEDGFTVTLYDLRHYLLTGKGFENFDNFIQENGTVVTDSPVFEFDDE